jgi:hypothetical protein
MTAVQATISTKPTWRYWDDAPPVRPPSHKRRLGAVLAYLIGTAGVGAAIFWPKGDQGLTLSTFDIPPSPFSATAAAALPQPSTPALSNTRQPIIAVRPALPKPAVKLLPHLPAPAPRLVSSASQVPAVVTPDAPAAQKGATTPEPYLAEPQRGSRQSQQIHDPNTEGAFRHRRTSHFRDQEAGQPRPSSTWHATSAPTTGPAPQTAADISARSSPSAAQTEG